MDGQFEFKRFLRKTRLETIVFLLIVLLISFLLVAGGTPEALIGLFSLLASKVLNVTVGVFLAHLLRIVAFDYTSLREYIDENNTGGVIFITAWYVIIIYAVSIGG